MRFALQTANSLLFPFAPHTAADGYQRLTGRARMGGAVAGGRAPLPRARHVRARLPGQRPRARPRRGAAGAARDELEQLALAAPNVHAHVDGKDVVKVIVVPDKLVNVVVR